MARRYVLTRSRTGNGDTRRKRCSYGIAVATALACSSSLLNTSSAQTPSPTTTIPTTIPTTTPTTIRTTTVTPQPATPPLATPPPQVTPTTPPAPAPAPTPAQTTLPPKPAGAVAPAASNRGSLPVQIESPFNSPGEGYDTQVVPARVDIGGTVNVNTPEGAVIAFTAPAGQAVIVKANRNWQMAGPTHWFVARGSAETREAVQLDETGTYVLTLERGLTAPATVSVSATDAVTVFTTAEVGQQLTVKADDPRQPFFRVPVKGGQRYRLTVPGSQKGFEFCANDWTSIEPESFGCVSSQAKDDSSTTFVPLADQSIVITASGDRTSDRTARVDIAPNDIFIDRTKGAVTDTAPQRGQSVVIPFWGTPAERAVVSSLESFHVEPWGQPWIDREDTASGRLRVFAVPIVFSPNNPPFVAWEGTDNDTTKNRRRYGVYRGDDTAQTIPLTGEPVTIRNAPWFASVASLPLVGGDRYVIQVTGKSIRPVSLALREPSGKFTSNISPWQWSEDGENQRAITTVSANRTGRWALELRPAGDRVRDIQISVLKVGSGSSFEGIIEVPDVLEVGDQTDVQLGPNEFARFTVKLLSANPQSIQPEVKRFRNSTFQPTAADLSLWDSRGRMVWSNNRNLEEEVLSGRLGKEPELSEKVATVADAEPYTLIVDPHTDIAGRFRVSVTSTPVISDVRLGAGPIALLPGGTQTGVVEVSAPTRYRFTGAGSACVSFTSTPELRTKRTCIEDRQSLTLPIGVHRFAFSPALKDPATFSVVPASEGPDPVATIDASIDGPTVAIVASVKSTRLRVNVAQPGTRILLTRPIQSKSESRDAPLYLPVITPEGLYSQASPILVARTAGNYDFLIAPSEESQSINVRTAPVERYAVSLRVGSKPIVIDFQAGQRVEGAVTLRAESRLLVNTYAQDSDYVVLYAEDARGRRYGVNDNSDIVLPAGSYRFVMVGYGKGRINLQRLPLGRPPTRRPRRVIPVGVLIIVDPGNDFEGEFN